MALVDHQVMLYMFLTYLYLYPKNQSKSTFSTHSHDLAGQSLGVVNLLLYSVAFVQSVNDFFVVLLQT